MKKSFIQAVVFDAVGTLIHPDPTAPEVYAAVGQHHGSQKTVAEIATRFRAAFARQEELDRIEGWKTSETREVERWRNIVAEVFDDLANAESCFQELFGYFARPQSWRCDANDTQVLAKLANSGLILGMASNYDQRLRSVVAGLPALEPIHRLVISSEVGWRKPSPEFFEEILRIMGQPAERILFVGDDLVNDVEGARAAGMRAVLLLPGSTSPGISVPRIREIAEVLEFFRKGVAVPIPAS